MIMRHKLHRVPGLNTTSTADISFMLLIFFLVTTSMDMDKGLTRRLPPLDPTEQQEEIDINRKHTMTLKLTADGRLLKDEAPIRVGILSNEVETLVKNAGAQHVIFIDTDPHASYGLYFQVQNQLARSYAHLRNTEAQQRFGHPYRLLSAGQQETIKEVVPIHISENYATEKGGRP